MGIIADEKRLNTEQILQQAVKTIEHAQLEQLKQQGRIPFHLKYKKHILETVLKTEGKKLQQQANDFVAKSVLIIANTVAEEDISPYVGEVQFSPDPAIPLIFQIEDYINGQPIEGVDWTTLTKSPASDNSDAVQIVEKVRKASGIIEKSVGVTIEYPADDMKLIEWLEQNNETETERIANRIVSIKNAQVISTIYNKALASTITGSEIVIDASIVQTQDGYRKTLIDIRNTIEMTADLMSKKNKLAYPNVLLIPIRYKTYIRDAYDKTFEIIKNTPTMVIGKFDEYIAIFHKLELADERIVMLVNDDSVNSVKFSIPRPLTYEMEMNDARDLTYIRSIKHIYAMYFYKPEYYLATIPLKYKTS